MKKVSKILILSLFTGLLYLLPISVMAADEPGPVAEIWIVTAKTGYMGNLQEAFKEHLAVRVKHGEPWNWQTYVPVVGDGLNRIGIRHCCVNWADVDSYQHWDRSNPEVLADWYEKVGPHVEKMEHYFERVDWSNSHWNEGADSSRLYGVTEWAIKGGHGADFAAAREKMSQIAINQGWANTERNWAWMTTVGGRSTESIVIPYKNYADMAPGEESFFQFLSKHLGSEEAAGDLLKSLSAASWGSSYTVWEHRPDLSMSKDG